MPFVVPPAPPLLRDPWAWAPVAAALVLVAHAFGPLIGEPVADDFYFLHRALLSGHRSLFDAGGAALYWRPLPRQVYYGVVGPLMLAHPLALVWVHAALMALAGVVLYRTLRLRWPGPWAAAAASFPLLADSARTLIAWPTLVQEVGALLLSALALHEGARRRLGTALAALLAGVLCKETTIVTALLLPWMPGLTGDQRLRARWMVATAVLVALWGAAYALVVRHAGLVFQGDLEAHPLPLGERLLWALSHALEDALSLPGKPSGVATAAFIGVLGLGLWFATRGQSRARWAQCRPWLAWGGTWFLLSTAMLSEAGATWGPFRSVFGMVGLGVALVPLAGALGRGWLGGLVALRLVTFSLSPGPPAFVTGKPREAGATMDFPQLTRLQHLVHDTRRVLQERFPTLPSRSIVSFYYLPDWSEYAYGGSRALQLWYRDTTLSWMPFPEFVADRGRRVTTFIEFQPRELQARGPQIALVEPDAVRSYLAASDSIEGWGYQAALRSLARADSLQGGRDAVVFAGSVAGARATCLLGLHREDEAMLEARRCVAVWPGSADGRYVIAVIAVRHGRWAEAAAEVDTMLGFSPDDERGLLLRRQILAARRSP
ncbi:MAG TPA: hypothetical protein VGK93_04785 [Candidatus Eisenbacteria bacterium]|jgi:hypothetical protein